MKTYESVIVLSKKIIQDNEGPRKFSHGRENFFYKTTGDPYEFRLKAAQKLFAEGACSSFILVGGDVEIVKNGESSKFLDINGQTVPKAEVMRFSLVNNYGVPDKNLVVLRSDSNTIGNAKEIARYFSEKNITDTKNIGVMTNFYDLPRTIKLFIEEVNLSLAPICAESIIYDEEYELIKKFYQEEGFERIINGDKQGYLEIKGMRDQETGVYASLFK